MSNSTVSSISSAALPNAGPRFATSQNTPRSHGRDDDREGGSQGLSLFSALLQALVSAASQSNAASATTPTGSSTATSSTTAASSAGNSSTATTPSSTSTAGSSLPQDLGAFLHDLFHALRQAGRQEWEGRHLEPLSSSTSGTTATSSTTATTGTTATSSTTATTGTAATSGTTVSTGTTSSTATGNAAVNSYRDHGIIGALQQLIKDLTNSQVVSGASTSIAAPGLSPNVVSNLNSAFQRLLADLGGTSATSGSQSDTTALKSFLQGFLQDLQSGNNSSGSGNVINAAA